MNNEKILRKMEKKTAFTLTMRKTHLIIWDINEKRWLATFDTNRIYRKQKGQVETIFFESMADGGCQDWNIGKEEVLYIIAEQYFC